MDYIADNLAGTAQIIFDFMINIINSLGYFGVFLFMMLSSSISPIAVPTELIITPASFIAVHNGVLNVYCVIVAGVLGSLIGAYGNYYLASFLASYALKEKNKFISIIINETNINKANSFFEKYGDVAIIFAHLVPFVRQFIPIPAGIAKMDIVKFTIYKIIGATIWCTLLAYAGIAISVSVDYIDVNTIHSTLSSYIIYVFIALFVILGLYFILKLITYKINNKS